MWCDCFSTGGSTRRGQTARMEVLWLGLQEGAMKQLHVCYWSGGSMRLERTARMDVHWFGLQVGAMRRLRVFYWSGGSMHRGLTAGMDWDCLSQLHMATWLWFMCY